MPIVSLLAFALAVLVFFIARRPDLFKVTRSALMAAPADAVFEQVNNLRRWDAWSPWAKLDPAAKNSFSGPEAGEGAAMGWDGNGKVGAGSMTITESRAPSLVRLRLEFVRPFKATNMAEFTFTPEGGQTRVAWSMEGKNNFIGKAMGLLMNCEKMVGKQFDQGLANIKSLVERS